MASSKIMVKMIASAYNYNREVAGIIIEITAWDQACSSACN